MANIGYKLSRQKNAGNMCRSRKLGEAEELLVFYFDLGAACTA
jgi:hypothetical protein